MGVQTESQPSQAQADPPLQDRPEEEKRDEKEKKGMRRIPRKKWKKMSLLTSIAEEDDDEDDEDDAEGTGDGVLIRPSAAIGDRNNEHDNRRQWNVCVSNDDQEKEKTERRSNGYRHNGK